MSVGNIVFLLFVAAAVLLLVLRSLRTHRNWPRKLEPLKQELGASSFRVLVKSKQEVIPGTGRWNQWVQWNKNFGGGPTLIIRQDSFEVVAPQGTMLDSRDIVIDSGMATMWLDKVGIGWAKSPFDSKECIHVAGCAQNGSHVELALTPREKPLEDAWNALLQSGVLSRKFSPGS